MKATLTDIAREVGVSKSLVSMYLNNHPLAVRIAVETKRKIDLAVERSGYRPSHAARTLSGGGNRILGMVIGGLTDPYFAHLADTALEEAAATGCQLLLAATRWNKAEEFRALENLVRHDCAGVLYTPELSVESPFLNQLSRENYPLILSSRSPAFSSAYTDYTEAHHAFAGFLTARGCPEATVCHLGPSNGLAEGPGEAFDIEGFRFHFQPPVTHFDDLARYLLETRPKALYILNFVLLHPILQLSASAGWHPHIIIRCGPGYDFVRHPLIEGAVFSRASEAVRQGIRTLATWIEKGAPPAPVRLLLPATFRSAEEIPHKTDNVDIDFKTDKAVNE